MMIRADLSGLAPRTMGERILHTVLLIVVLIGLGASLVAIGWFLLEGLQLLVVAA